jgi:hypothetical protein
VAQRLDADGDGAGPRPFYEVATRLDGLVGHKARVRLLELEPAPKVDALHAVSKLTAHEPELHKRVAALLHKFAPDEPRSIELPPEDTHLEIELRPLHDAPEAEAGAEAPAPSPPARIVPVRIEGMDDSGLRVTSATGTHTLPFGKILGLALGRVPAEDGRTTVLTDLVLSWADAGKGSTVLRASLGDLGLDRLYPGVAPKEAYWRLVGEIEKRSDAPRLPPGSEHDTLPRYAGPDEMTRSVHGD